MMRAGSSLCAGRESVRNAVPEGGSAAWLTAMIGPWTRGEVGSGWSGTVFEFPICSPDPAEWLPALCRKEVQEAVVVLPCSPGADWFQKLEDGKWLCCFTRGAAMPTLIAYRGQRKHAFWLAFHEMGAILHAGDHD